MKLTKISILLLMSLFTFTCDESTKNIVLPEENIFTCDDCGVCDTDSNNNNITCTDCSGELNGNHEYDECNVCNDYTSNNGVQPQPPYGDCDCLGKIIQIDDDGNSMGHAKLDDCDKCNPGTILAGPFGFIDIDCEDCNGELGGTAFKDGCDVCVGGATGIEPCDLDCNEEVIVIDVSCSDFSDDLLSCDDTPGCTYESGSDCLPISYGYVDECGSCVTEPDENCMQICDCQWSNDENIPLEYPLCIALQNCQSECNTSENAECILIESAYYCVEYENWNDKDCAGLCVSGTPNNGDYYMYCSTTGATFTELNYALCELPGSCGGECLLFVPESHSDADIDECGVCSGGVTGHDANSDKDCTGTCFGSASTDYCDICVGGNTGLEACPADCANIPNGDNIKDECGTCDSDPTNNCVQDCYGIWGGTGVLDECVGECAPTLGSTTAFTCVGGGNNGSNCNGMDDFTTCIGWCRESISDPNWNSQCILVCDDGYIYNGEVDNCGVCDDDLNNDCIRDCTIEENDCNGTWFENECWGGDAVEDCAGDCNGNAILDVCGECNAYLEDGGNQPPYPYGNCGCFDETASNFWCNGDAGTCNEGNMVIQGITEDEYCKVECLDFGDIINPCGESINSDSTCEDNSLYFNTSCEYEELGCTDENANNYDSNANNCEDGTNSCCTYAEVTLSFGEITSSTIEVFMQNSESVGGFQFDLTGGSALSGNASGGSASDYGFSVSSGGTLVFGFSLTGSSIPIGSGLLTIVDASLVSEPICIDNIVISDASGGNLDISTNPICSE
jgi:hypothetical protein